MKSSLFFLAIGIFLQSQAIRDKVFRARREYVYRYEAQLVTGLEPFASIHSGFRLSATARVQFVTASEVRVLLDKLFIYRINKPVKQYQADSNILPGQFISELTTEDLPKIIAILKMPFGFQYTKGHVVRVVLSDMETEWSANTKRGFVSLFEVNLEKRMLLQQLSQATDSIQDPRVDNYKVIEKAVTGVCATSYTVKFRHMANHLFVSKVRDFEDCIERPVYFKTMMDGYVTPTHQKDNPLSIGATVEYSLSGTTTRFLILSAIAQTKTLFSPVKQRGEIKTTVNQTLYLKDSGPIQANNTIVEIHQGQRKNEELQMTLPSKPVDPQDPFQSSTEEARDTSNPSDVYPVDAIYMQLVHAAENTKYLTSHEALVRLRVVVSMLKTSPGVIIRELWQKVYSGESLPQGQLPAKALWNVLPHVGTEDAAIHILNVCTNDMTMRSNCTTALNTLILKVTPTTTIIQKLITLIETHATKDRPDKLTQVSYLSLGSLAYKLSLAKYWKMEDIKKVNHFLDNLRRRDNNKFVRKYLASKRRDVKKTENTILNVHARTNHMIVETIKKLIDNGTQAERILGLKSLANAGETESLPILKMIITDRDEPLFIRIFAITAHRRMYLEEAARLEAIGMLLGVYQDSKEMNEIRTVAFSTMMGLWPEEAVITGIAQSLHFEKDIQVSQYVTSYLDRVANSSYTAIWELNKRCKDAMKFSPPNYKADLYHPFEKSFGKMFPDYKAGIDFRVASIGHTYKYESLSFGVDTYIYGLHSTFLEMGINSEGLSHVLTSLFGPKGLLTTNKSVLDLIKRAPRSVKPQAIIDEIFRSLKIKPRTESLPTAHIYYMLMGHELGYVDFTDILNGIVTQGQAAVNFDPEQLQAGLSVHYEDMFYLHDTQLTLPSEAGLPVSLKLQLSTTMKVDGLITADVLPFLFKSDRKDQPPSTITASVDLKPKIVTALYGSMGLDWHHIKPALAFRGLFKNAMPIKNDMIYDIAGQNFKIINFVPKLSKPNMEVLIEPFGEFQAVDVDSRLPMVRIDRTPMVATTGTKIMPLNLFHDIDVLGLKVGVQGQIPDNWGLKTPLRPLSGRTILNFYLSSMDQAANAIIIQSQIVSHKPDIPKSAKANSTSTRADKLGPKKQPIPQAASEPVDLDKETVSLRQLVAKMEQVTSRDLASLVSAKNNLGGLVISTDASTDQVTRKAQLDILWGKVNDGLSNVGMFHLWRSAIRGYDDKEWEMTSFMESSYPYKQYESKDIFSVEWQRQIIKDIQYFVSMKTHKVANELINRTLLSGLEQMNFPAMTRVPAYRVVNSLVPQVLNKLVNDTGLKTIQRNWKKYWETLGPLSFKVEEEKKLLLDPTFINRDAILISYFVQLMDIQKTLITDLDFISSRMTMVYHSELPVMQWVIFTQERVIYMLQEIVTRNAAKKSITKIRYFKKKLEQSKKSLTDILEKSHMIIAEVVSLSKDGQDRMVCFPDRVKKSHSPDVNDEQCQDEAAKISDPHEKNLIQSLHDLSLTQMQVIEDIHQAILEERAIEKEFFPILINSTIGNLTLIDKLWRVTPFEQEAIKEKILLITIQNEMIIDLLYQHYVLVENTAAEGVLYIDSDTIVNFFHYFVKVQSYYLGQRAAGAYKFKMLKDVVIPQLTSEEVIIYWGLQDVFRNLDVDLRKFQNTSLTTPVVNPGTDEVFRWFTQSIDSYITQISSMQKTMVQLEGVPKVYLVSELVDTINYMKHAVELARSTTLPMVAQNRLCWIEVLDNQATDVQVLLSSMSPIFNKFSSFTSASQPGPAIPVLSDSPGDARLAQVQHVIVKQLELVDELRRHLQHEQVSSKTVQKVIENAIDRSELLQSMILQSEPAVILALEQKEVPDSSYVNLITQAINQQRQLRETLRSAISDNRDLLEGRPGLAVRMDNHEEQLSLAKMEAKIYQKLTEKSSREGADSSAAADLNIPAGIRGFVNTTWGHIGDKQEMKIKIFAGRSLEQMMWIFKQMDAIVRSQEVIRDINKNLGFDEFSERQTMDALNSYNHLHFITSLDKITLPDWVNEYSTRLQDYLKMVMWKHYTWQQPEKEGAERHQIVLDISDFNKKVDMIMMNKMETNKFLSVPLPQWLNAFKFNQNSRSLQRHLVSYISQDYLPAKCVVRDNKVKTIDTVEFQIQTKIDKCRTLLAMDCSSAKSFAVTIIKSRTTYSGHTVQVVGEDKVIEIQPDYLNVLVRVNEIEQDLKDNEPLVWRRKLDYELLSKYLMITRNGEKIEVEMPLTGLYITVKGSYIKIEISQTFRHKICGLCGNFDSQKSWEFEGPLREVYTSPISFASSYVLPGNLRCDSIRAAHEKTAAAAIAATAEFVPRYLNIPNNLQRVSGLKDGEWIPELDVDQHFYYRDGGAEDRDPEDYDSGVEDDIESTEKQTVKPDQLTDIRESKKRDQVCFSRTPVLKCPATGYVAVKTRIQTVEYICLDSDDPQVESLRELVSSTPILDLVTVQGEPIRRRMRLDLECRKLASHIGTKF
ncbi:hypothetical protein RRG08_018098 [Elysia crispata]|uniref:Vitellogenin n=1 Tax=Elysia crispata TaxID=231223 RepID=A0AAE0ZD32_9GAST|nr:hypothetical protein RRG08_018098 [Elysia crispata]